MKVINFTRKSKPKKTRDKNGDWVFEEDPLTHEMQVSQMNKYIEGKYGKLKTLVFSQDSVSRDEPFEKWVELKKAIEILEKGDIFIVWKSDRLMADNHEIGRMMALLSKKEIIMLSATEEGFFENDPIYRIYRFLSVEFNKIELDKIRDRTRESLQTKRARGERVGHIPYGYRVHEDGKKLLPSEYEQSVLTQMETLYSLERCTYRQVAESLNSKGILNREGRTWSPSSVYRILKNRIRHAEVYFPESLGSPALHV